MAIIRTDVVDGPNIQADGSYRGVIEFEFDDARIVRRSVRAPDASSWSALLLTLEAEVQASQERQDADAIVDPDVDISANGQANQKQVALVYLRKAYQTGDPWIAYKLFDRFNAYRVSQGWTLGQVQTQLATVGLTQEEWDLMAARYSYLSQTNRVTAMSGYQDVLAGDTWGAEFR